MLDLGQAPGSGGLHWPLLDKHVGPGRKSRLLKNKTRNFEADVTRVPSKSAAYLPFVCSIAADSNTRVRPHYARGRRGVRFLPCFFFRAAIASGLVTVILRTFSAPFAEACSPQRFREENAVVRFISLS